MSLESASPARESRARPSRWWPVLAGLAAGLAVSVPVAWASHQFTDVSNANRFHTDISAIAGAGITSGKTCVPPGAPPTYCPEEPVTREAMAAFMHRGLTRGTGGPIENHVLTDSFESMRTLTITAGGLPGGSGFLKVDAQVAGFANIGEATCPCQAEFQVLVDGVHTFTEAFTQVDSFAESGLGIDQSAITGVVPVSTGAPHTIDVQGMLISGTGTIRGYGHVSAIYFPFGRTGGSTLSSPGKVGGPNTGQ